jgi:hypothetical protein
MDPFKFISITMFDELPEELKEHIRSFLLPETRFVFYHGDVNINISDYSMPVIAERFKNKFIRIIFG